jgi:glycosyltransferase involved in cell wall biosynthesis
MKIFFLVTEDWYFYSHRLGLARRIRQAGAEVFVMTRVNDLGDKLRDEGFTVIPWQATRGSLNPLRELFAFVQVCRALRQVRPDLVHHVALKPIVYGGLAGQLFGKLPAINALAGLGEVFWGRSFKLSLIRKLLVPLLRVAINPTKTLTLAQNSQNLAVFVGERIVSEEHIRLIRGVGVDTEYFSPRPEPTGVPTVLLASRMLWSKGIGEFVEAARLIRERGVDARFILVGKTDSQNPAGIPKEQLESWSNSGVVEWLGYKESMTEVLNDSNVVCLPSYGEGIPKILLEAAACARAIVTTNVPGCCDVVRAQENGLLVPSRDAAALAEAIVALLRDPELRTKMGTRGREIVLNEFTERRIVQQTFEVYRELLGEVWSEVESPSFA